MCPNCASTVVSDTRCSISASLPVTRWATGSNSTNRRNSSMDRDVAWLLDILSQLRPDLPQMHGCRGQDLEASPRAAQLLDHDMRSNGARNGTWLLATSHSLGTDRHTHRPATLRAGIGCAGGGRRDRISVRSGSLRFPISSPNSNEKAW